MEGSEVVVEVKGPGQVVGEVFMQEAPPPCRYNARARGDVLALKLTQENYIRALASMYYEAEHGSRATFSSTTASGRPLPTASCSSPGLLSDPISHAVRPAQAAAAGNLGGVYSPAGAAAARQRSPQRPTVVGSSTRGMPVAAGNATGPSTSSAAVGGTGTWTAAAAGGSTSLSAAAFSSTGANTAAPATTAAVVTDPSNSSMSTIGTLGTTSSASVLLQPLTISPGAEPVMATSGSNLWVPSVAEQHGRGMLPGGSGQGRSAGGVNGARGSSHVTQQQQLQGFRFASNLNSHVPVTNSRSAPLQLIGCGDVTDEELGTAEPHLA